MENSFSNSYAIKANDSGVYIYLMWLILAYPHRDKEKTKYSQKYNYY